MASSTSAVPLHSSLSLYISDAAYTLVPNNQPDQQALVINRLDSSLSLAPPGKALTFDSFVPSIAGILGIITFLKSDYLLLIPSAKKLTTVLKCPVYTPTKFAVYPLSLEPNAALIEHADERYLLAALKAHLDYAIGRTFFTYNTLINPADPEPWDITSSLQRQTDLPKRTQEKQVPLWERADERFFWNKHLQTRFIQLAAQESAKAASRFILPIMFGFLEFRSCFINAQSFTFGLVSRRSRHRAGTRYFTRGIDLDGDVANFNETEMIVFTTPSTSSPHTFKSSYVQTRGSVPVFWSEINNLRYRPDLKIMDIPQTKEALKTHFEKQVEIYGDQYLVNLVNASGYEKAVKDAYEKGVRELGNPRIHYTYFDFHHECKGLRFDRVQGLIDKLQDDLISQGYFYQDSSSKAPIKRQTSVVRTNCMDCLDRTNVLQSALAKWVLTAQLKQAGILSGKETLDGHADFMFLFRNLWADNADAVSNAYSGSGALKTDFTRFGVRSKKGALNDGFNSLKRYIKNNFLDGPRQDAYDLFTGSWTPGSARRTGLGDQSNPVNQVILLVLVIFSLMFISAVFTENRSLKVAVFSLAVSTASMMYIAQNGVEFVNGPKLRDDARREVLMYDGPGFESSRRGRGASAGKKLVGVGVGVGVGSGGGAGAGGDEKKRID